MTMIFFNIAWMENYNGETDADKPKDGGNWEEKSEICNFADVEGRCYGFVFPANMGAINIDKIGADPTDELIDGVTIVWTAKRANFGTVVVGWFQNAIVHRNVQLIENSPLHDKNNVNQYYAECYFKNATLLKPAQRTFKIPRGEGGMGQYLIWYADTKLGTQTKDRIEKYIAETTETLALESSQIARVGQGIKSIGAFDPEYDELHEDIEQIEAGHESPSTKAVLIAARIGQGKFRKNLDLLWNQSCALTGCTIREVLRASHIKAWRDCANNKERLDPDNGLLLAAHLDALFDKHLVSFSDDGAIMVSDRIEKAEIERLQLFGKLRRRPNDGQKRYLAAHRNRFVIKTR